MPLDITFTLSDEDLQKFQDSVDKGRKLVTNEDSAVEIEDAASKMIAKVKEFDLPQFICDRLFQLEILINMIRDKEWKLTKEECDSIRGALYYFVDPDDVIPDHIPGIGFLDDAMYAEIIVNELKI